MFLLSDISILLSYILIIHIACIASGAVDACLILSFFLHFHAVNSQPHALGCNFRGEVDKLDKPHCEYSRPFGK